MPRFVLLWHACPSSYGKSDPKGSHWDFLLEDGGALATWNLFELPSAWNKSVLNEGAAKPKAAGIAAGQRPAGARPDELANSRIVAAEKIQDHRLAYLDYEGPITSENPENRASVDKGSVERIDGGEYRLLERSETLWRVELAGEFLQGIVELRFLQEGDWRLEVGSP
ncbi:hypothetical protein [Adhaeretor mobilis]|nr:hypothetical protein [Adhaeretor mobilis]